MIKEIMSEVEDKMKKTVHALDKELSGLRAGRATPAILDRILVEYYGVMTPLNQLSTITVPESRILSIQPWDKSMIKVIDKAIQKSDLGMMPQSDGNVVRLIIPLLTTERRTELVKSCKKKAEEARVGVRNLRRTGNDMIHDIEKTGEISEDAAKRAQEEMQKLTDKYVKEIDEYLASKEAEIMEI
ncbi:MAG: ribosome recycling factor [bacterium]|nr:ribosome recycling factor [bacterium]